MINLKLSQKINKNFTYKHKIKAKQTNNNTHSVFNQSIQKINSVSRFEYKMGILQSCQGTDSRMAVSLDSNLFRQQSISKYSHDDFYFQQSKVQLFGDIFYKKLPGGNKSQFVLQTNHVNRNSQVINLALRIYQDSNQFILQKGNKIKIINCIQDPNILQSLTYVIKLTDKPQQLLLKTIPFNRFQQERFKKGLYEATMLQRLLKEENNRFVYGYRDAFVIESGIDKDHNDKCLVLVGDYCSASLGEMIAFRKLSNMSWTENRFQTLCSQLIKGLLEMHKQGIAHRDIRPGNIFYSQPKKGYVIGGLANSIQINQKTRSTPNTGYNLSGVPYYLPRYLLQIGKKQNYSQYYNYDPFKNDIYALGVTLLNALFLDTLTPVQILMASLKKYETKYSYLNILKQMVSQNPPSLQQMLKTLPDNLPSSGIDQKSNIESLRYKLQPQDSQFVTRKKTIANGYYQLFMYDEWVEEINEVVNYYELNQDYMQLAELYRKIADIYAQHHQQEMMMEYFSKASHVYLKIASDCLEEKKTSEAIKYLEKGIDCNRKGFKGEPNSDLSNLLNKLAMAHHLKAQYEIARAFQQEAVEITAKVHGQKSLQFAQMLIDSARIESDFQQFKQAQNMLKLAKQVTEKLNESSQTLRVKARVLEALGTNYRMKAIERRDKCDAYRSKAEENLLDALKIIQQLQGSIHPQVGSILMALGNVYFDKRQFTQAKKSYERSLIVKQHTLKGRFNVQVGQCLTYLANSQKCLKQYEKAIKHYDQAIQVFRKAYGNDHNENTAVAIGNLGLVYKELGRRSEERQYLSLAKSILKDLFGVDCPDYQYFDRQMSRG